MSTYHPVPPPRLSRSHLLGRSAIQAQCAEFKAEVLSLGITVAEFSRRIGVSLSAAYSWTRVGGGILPPPYAKMAIELCRENMALVQENKKLRDERDQLLTAAVCRLRVVYNDAFSTSMEELNELAKQYAPERKPFFSE
jgi:transposase-like protein